VLRQEARRFPEPWFNAGMARPRKVTDGAVLAACERVIGQHGPNFTLAQVAAEAGVAVGTVAGRFGSKHGLLVALMDTSTAALEERMRAVAQEHDDPIEAVRAALLVTVVGIDDPETAAQHLGQLGVDLADPVLRARFARQREVVREVLAELIGKASLPGAPAAESAAAMLASLAQGVQLDWALAPEGALPERLGNELDTLLQSWRNPVSGRHVRSRRGG